MRRLMHVEKKRPGEFRMLRCLDARVNLARLKKHAARLQQRMHGDLAYRRIKMKTRRRHRSGLPAGITR